MRAPALIPVLMMAIACGPRVPAQHPQQAIDHREQRATWHQAVGDPSWWWHRGVAGWELQHRPVGERPGPEAGSAPVRAEPTLEAELERTETLRNYTPLRQRAPASLRSL